MSIAMEPIGIVRSPFENAHDLAGVDASCVSAVIEVNEPFVEGMADIKAGDRLSVVFYFHRSTQALLTVPLKGKGPLVGVFSSHSPTRPNFIGITDATVEAVDGNRISIRGCDMLDGTPVLDLKPATA